MEDECVEQTLLVVREVAVYKIPPRNTSGGYKCGEWLQSDKIWAGRLRVVSMGEKCEIRLEDFNSGELFAICPVEQGKREATVESVADSSRYFVLRIDDGRGKHAFIGLGFSERNDAFDFNVALSDHEKYVKREMTKEEAEASDSQHEALDLRLKEGETIRINVKNRLSATAAAGKNAPVDILGTGRMKAPLAPPPGGGRIRSPLPPPPATQISPQASSPITDPFSDLSQLQFALPKFKSSTPPASASASASVSDAVSGSGSGAGWTAF